MFAQLKISLPTKFKTAKFRLKQIIRIFPNLEFNPLQQKFINHQIQQQRIFSKSKRKD